MEKKIRQINIYRTNLAVANPDDEDINAELLINSVSSDPDGNETERIVFDASGEPEERSVIIYANGQAVEEVLELNGEHAEKTTREFDANGRVIREFRHYLDGEPDKIAYEYDHDGHLIKRLLTDSDSEEGEKHLWIYNDGLLVREEDYNEYGSLESSKAYTYNEEKKPEEIVELTFSGNGETRLVTLFDSSGRIEAEKRYDGRGRLIARSIYTFDEKGNNSVIDEESVSGTTRIELHYDDAGNNIRQEETATDGTVVTTIERTFDSDNHPVKTEVRMESVANRPGQHYKLRYEYLFFE